MIALGIDPGLRHTGLVLVQRNGGRSAAIRTLNAVVPQRESGDVALRRLVSVCGTWLGGVARSELTVDRIGLEGQFLPRLKKGRSRPNLSDADVARIKRQQRDALDIALCAGLVAGYAAALWPGAQLTRWLPGDWRRKQGIPPSLKRAPAKAMAIQIVKAMEGPTTPEGSAWDDHRAEARLIAETELVEAALGAALEERR